MTIFKSRQVQFDQEIIDRLTTGGWTAEVGRPEFEPTRDPLPWRNRYDGSRWADPGVDEGALIPGAGVLDWAPCREQFDAPVNRVLLAFRDRNEVRFDPDTTEHRVVMFLANPIMVTRLVPDATPDEINHARRVLTRLANWKEQ